MSNKTNKYLIYIVFLEKDINSESALPLIIHLAVKSRSRTRGSGDPVGSSPTRRGAHPV